MDGSNRYDADLCPLDEVPNPGPLRNWKGSEVYQPARLVRVHSERDIVRVVTNPDRFPSPVRVMGSHHSTTKCVVAEGGTVLDMTGMHEILEIDEQAKTIRMQAGVRLIDAARELARHGLQFHVNIELGNLTVGSGACCGTKEASYFSSASGAFEYGQVCSYVVGFKLVKANGDVVEIKPGDGTPARHLEALRSSYGMLGVIFEVTYSVKTLRAMELSHHVFHVEEFAQNLDRIVCDGRSSMLYLFPFLDRVVVERRQDNAGAIRSHWQWRARNLAWETVSPALSRAADYLPWPRLRFALIDGWCELTVLFLRLLSGSHTSPADQIIEYRKKGGFAAYTFSIWAFDKSDYPRVLLEYFAFCKQHYREHGYRCDMLNVGYALRQDAQSLFSYTRRGFSLTLDPVSTGRPGWDHFLEKFNAFCSERGGKPLFNQTPHIKPEQAKAAFGDEIAKFLQIRREWDPDERFYTEWFEELFE